MWLFALFLIVPLIEISLFITVGGWLTLWPTLGLVLLTGIIGTTLMRWQGMQVLAELRGDMGQLQNPLSPLAHGALIVVAGLLLLTPGFFTDTIGFLLMVPAVRAVVIRWVGSKVQIQSFGQSFEAQSQMRSGPAPGSQGRGYGPIIDGEFHELDEDPPRSSDSNSRRNSPPSGPSGWTRH